jgi:hypothetical protein
MMATVSQLFSLRYGHSLELNRLVQSDEPEAINFVSRTARNNGVSARVRRIPDREPAPAGTITVALNGEGGAGEAFLQPFPYYCGFHVMILMPKSAMAEQEKLWWVMCITANRFRFGFGRQANRTLKDLILPDPTSIPEWVALANTDRFGGADTPAIGELVPLSSPLSWREYSIKSLFDIKKGKRLTKANMLPGTTPYIGATDSSNGITTRIGQRPIHDGNTISVSYNGSVAEAFYQPVPFWATDDANVLYPKFKMAPEHALFLCTIIRQEKYRYNYGRKWHLERMRESVIRLPATPSGDPDLDFMGRYIKTLPYSSQIGTSQSSNSLQDVPDGPPLISNVGPLQS